MDQRKVPTVYNGRDNSIDLALLDDERAIDAGFVTGVSVNIRDKKYGTLLRHIEGRTGQPDAQPGLFVLGNLARVPGHVEPIKIVSLKLGLAMPRIPAAPYYWLELLIFSPIDVNGFNWEQFPIAVIDP
jgi:hypothetical protein